MNSRRHDAAKENDDVNDDTRYILPDLNFLNAERALCTEALRRAGSIVEAAALLGMTRHGLKRRIIKHSIKWPMETPVASPPPA